MTWFETLTGFKASSAQNVHLNIQHSGPTLLSLPNNRTMQAGQFLTPSLAKLRSAFDHSRLGLGCIDVDEMVADVKALHQDPTNENAVFQVASQFNCLEMASPGITPEAGVGIYRNDPTQGPACSISAGAGTIFRNYFADVNGHIGQSKKNQIDGLAEIGIYFDNSVNGLWRMQNGYCFPYQEGLAKIESQLSACSETQLDQIRKKLRVGVQQDTEITLGQSNHLVTQVFCSALPVAYSDIPANQWDLFPRLILDATYEATFLVALQNLHRTGCNKLYLTLVGGGVFGNQPQWIFSAIARALKLFAASELSVKIVSFGSSNGKVQRFFASL